MAKTHGLLRAAQQFQHDRAATASERCFAQEST
jgi:hypothetical protein